MTRAVLFGCGGLLSGILACDAEKEPASPRGSDHEIVAAVHPPTWFEDGWSYWEVSPDGSQGLLGARFGSELYELGHEAPVPRPPSGSVDEVVASTFSSSGFLLLLGEGEAGFRWYAIGPEGREQAVSVVPPGSIPRWSADGSALALFEPGDGQIRVETGVGSWEHNVGGSVTGLGWAPDGTTLYVLSSDEPGMTTLYRLDPLNGSPAVVWTGLDAPPRFNSVAVSPDGGRVFLALAGAGPPDAEARHQPYADRDTDIYALDIASLELAAVVTEPGDDFHPQVIGEYLYWTHNELVDQVVALPSFGGEAHVILEDAQIPYWTADGSQIGFTYGPWRIADWGLNLDAGVVAVDSEAQPASEPMPIVEGYHEDFTPAWSPDGRWMVYHSHRSDKAVAGYASEGSTDDLYLRRVGAPVEEEIRLTDFGWEVGVADWAPDSRRLVFDSWERGGSAGISRPWLATIDPESGEALSIDPLQVPEGLGGTLFAAWSPVADELAIVERVEGKDQTLWLVDLTSGAWDRILNFQASTYGGLDWMPDGQSIVFAALHEGRMQLHSVALQSREVRTLTNDSENLIHPQVSPDGRWVAASRVYRSKEARRIRIQ
jgi:dipeptidyl aminopeptidase/acylaminoacyl peptidase